MTFHFTTTENCLIIQDAERFNICFQALYDDNLNINLDKFCFF
jgi:hypothetical protein